MNYRRAELLDIVGKTPTSITQNGDDEIVMSFSDGSTGVLYHEQDCCESVVIDDVNGDWVDLLGNPLLVADERVSESPPNDAVVSEWDDSNTWTFYTFRNVSGSVDVRWHGSSNGYYSEGVNFKLKEAAV
jgi:hypothetical protein